MPADLGGQGALRRAARVLVGRELRDDEAAGRRITPVEGLSALSLDALTSVAYGPEAIVLVLAVAGAGAMHVVLPISVSIVVLLSILVFSYRQVIDAYPHGGGAYAVSRANLGRNVSLVAAASLVVDYTLNVAVSLSAGVTTLTSAYPSLLPYNVDICLGILALITVMNLRGLGETARAFLLPTMVFIIGTLGTILIGLVHPLAANASQPGASQIPTHGLQALGVLLVLKAFSAGCSALTGVEAIANGVPLFKEPRAARAKRTEMLLGVILGMMLLGLSVLIRKFHIVPRANVSVLSQVFGASLGRHWAFFILSLTTLIVLSLAANTSFGGLPVLASLLARDNFLPHIFLMRGDRQVYSNGIIALAGMSAALLVAVHGNTNTLIPMFAIGVFTGFTLSQSGLVVHWWRSRPPRWRRRAVVNATGALVTATSTLIFLFSKFLAGAWIVVVAVPFFLYMFHRVQVYYSMLSSELGFGEMPPMPEGKDTLVIVPVTRVSTLTSHVLSEAKSLGDKVVAITVDLSGDDHERRVRLEQEWRRWGTDVTLEILTTHYASVVTPIVEYIDSYRKDSDDQIVVLIPIVIPDRFRFRLLHNQIDVVLSAALHSRTDVVVARVPVVVTTERHRHAQRRRAGLPVGTEN